MAYFWSSLPLPIAQPMICQPSKDSHPFIRFRADLKVTIAYDLKLLTRWPMYFVVAFLSAALQTTVQPSQEQLYVPQQ